MRLVLSIPLFALTLVLAPVVLVIAILRVVTSPHEAEREYRR